MWKYSNPAKIIYSEAFADEVSKLIVSRRNILVICSKRFQSTEDFVKFKHSLNHFYLFTEIENNPSFNSYQKAITFAKDYQPDTIIAIGGGSVIDTAKTVRMAIYKSCYDIQKFFVNFYNQVNKPLFIAIPTTHGTSSELTMWATVWDKVNKKKYSLSEYNNYPDYAIYDVNLVKSLPIPISLSTTLDALSHSFEALWNKHSNPISDNFAIYAIKLIIDNLGRLVEPVSIEVRKNLLIASMYAGLAFSNTKTAAAHSISYPLSSYFNIPHGIACSMPLYPLLKINEVGIQNKLSHLLKILQLHNIDEFWNKVLISVKGKIPFTLHEYGIKKTDINWLLDLSFTKSRMDNSIIELSRNDVLNILEEIY